MRSVDFCMQVSGQIGCEGYAFQVTDDGVYMMRSVRFCDKRRLINILLEECAVLLTESQLLTIESGK